MEVSDPSFAEPAARRLEGGLDWRRLEGVSFLTGDEKRAAAGYGVKQDAGDTKFNSYHDELGLFTTPDRARKPR
ncbi:hypothetical protein [Hyphomicrobium sp.]|uniref:hypothetical protein n=1 Tax=Hyphomicrobium sp. TaxID=82 RepID=UPI002D77AB6D|nr:hypothetical protein [Hyphomicrobium sp.]HET6390783.1 hypothetical protein [Hyphomicrobium sp.]